MGLQWGRRDKLTAGVKDERFKVLLGWAEAYEAKAPTMMPDASNVGGTTRFAQHLFASLVMSTGPGTEAPSRTTLWGNTSPRFEKGSSRGSILRQRTPISIS